MVIKQNISAINVDRRFGITYGNQISLAEKLSSGYRINRSADDAAGLSISEKMRRQIRGLTQAALNAQDGISLVQSAEGALQEVHSMLQRMNELAIQSTNGTNSEEDRKYLQQEVSHMLTEIDRIAGTTTFNELVLLDGGKKEETSGIEKRRTKVTVFDLTSFKITNTVKPEHKNAKEPAWESVATLLAEQIVPQAVTDLLETFPSVFGYLEDANIGIGLQMANRPDSTTVASVTLETYAAAGTPADVDLFYALTVNMNYITLDGNNQIEDYSRRNLEHVIAHEMMHALMMESLTAGMIGRDQNLNIAEGFPLWFVEGTAQAAGGGAGDVRLRLRIDKDSTEDDIKAAIERNDLGSGNANSLYGTGYLAAMYLGYLVSGGTSMDKSQIAAGIDRLLYEIRGGKSLSQVITENTRYSGIDDFEASFARDGSVFTKQLLELSQDGVGALVGDNYSAKDILEDTPITDQPLFKLYPDHERVLNEYKDGYDILEGGLAQTSGVAGPGHPNYGNQGGTTPGGNQGGITPGGNQGGTTPGGNQGGSTPGGSQGGTTPGGNQGGSTPGGNQGGTIPGRIPGTGILAAGRRKEISLHLGIESNQKMTLHIQAMNTKELGIRQMDISIIKGAEEAIDLVAQAIEKVSAQRSRLGAYQNRLEHTINNLENVVENTTASESLIRDSDMAKLMVEYSNNQILLQAGQAVMAQANKNREYILFLFR